MQSIVLSPKKQTDLWEKILTQNLIGKILVGKRYATILTIHVSALQASAPLPHVCKRCKSEFHGESQCNTQKESSI